MQRRLLLLDYDSSLENTSFAPCSAIVHPDSPDDDDRRPISINIADMTERRGTPFNPFFSSLAERNEQLRDKIGYINGCIHGEKVADLFRIVAERSRSDAHRWTLCVGSTSECAVGFHTGLGIGGRKKASER